MRGLKIRFFHRLLIGFLLVGGVLVSISALGISFIRSDSKELGQLMNQQLRPMGQISALLGRANEIRRQEVELPRIKDYFANNARVDELRGKQKSFRHDLQKSLLTMTKDEQAQNQLVTAWLLYQRDLEKTLDLAMQGQLTEAEEHSTYLSAPRFAAFANALGELNTKINKQTAALYTESLSRQEHREKLFLVLSLTGILIGFAVAVGFSRFLSVRLSVLRDGANRLAQGDMEQVFINTSADELGDLADALNEMRLKIKQREQALRDFSNNLEAMVLERTKELSASNQKLRDSEASLQKAQALAGLGSWEYQAKTGTLKLSQQLQQILACSEAQLPADPELLAKRFFSTEELAALQKLFQEKKTLGQIFGIEQRIRNGRGERKSLWLEAEWTLDRQGRVEKAMGIALDISERKQMEEQLLRSQRLDAIGQLAGGIAHDFNNLLGVIIGNTFMAQRHSLGDDRQLRYLGEIHKASERAKELAFKLLTFAKGGEDKRELFSLSELLCETVELTMAGFRLSPRLEIAPDLWPVNGDRSQIGQVLQNLLLNARDAMEKQGDQIIIGAANVTLGDTGNPDLPPGPYLQITVMDSGAGIAEEDLPRIFDLFFSTKKRGAERGTGLGLAICHSVVRKHRGDLLVDSTPGKGTTFTCYLPATAGQVQDLTSKEGILYGQGRILVMDDELMIRKIAEEQLTYLGYQAETVSCGEEALLRYRQAQEDHSPFNAVILDLTIRDGMGGHDTLNELLKIDPNVKAIASSGYSDQSVKVSAEGTSWSASVGKPYRIEELSQALYQLLS